MKGKLMVVLLVLLGNILAYMPLPTTGYPDIPYLYDFYNFKTIKSLVFPRYSAGMYIDKYSDLNLNSAYITRIQKNSVYFDFGNEHDYGSVLTARAKVGIDLTQYNGRLWWTYSNYSSLNQNPLYNLGLLLPLNNRLKIALYNRAIFDYGPFYRVHYYESWEDKIVFFQSLGNEVPYDTSAIFSSQNQQKLLGFQPGIITGYRLNSRTNIAFKLECLKIERDGDLFSSYWNENPHNYYYYLDDFDINIPGKQMNLGLGILYDLTIKTTIGLSGGMILGSAHQTENVLDTSQVWSENALEPDYYDFSHQYSKLSKSSKSDGKRKYLSLNMETMLNEKTVVRTGFLYNCLTADYSTKFSYRDTSFINTIYKYYDWANNSYHKRKYESYRKSNGGFTGNGNKKEVIYTFFNSIIFRLTENFQIFTGIFIQKTTEKVKVSESYKYYYNNIKIYSLYKPEDSQTLNDYKTLYSYTAKYKSFSFNIPAGMELKLSDNLKLLLSVSFNSHLTELQKNGEMLYPYKISKKWENGELKVDNEETNRFELYSESPPKDFDRNLSTGVGIEYSVKDRFRVFVKAGSDISLSNLWLFGFEYSW